MEDGLPFSVFTLLLSLPTVWSSLVSRVFKTIGLRDKTVRIYNLGQMVNRSISQQQQRIIDSFVELIPIKLLQTFTFLWNVHAMEEIHIMYVMQPKSTR